MLVLSLSLSCTHICTYIHIYIYVCYPPGLSTLFGHFWVDMTEVAHCPGCDTSRPIKRECLVDAKVRRGLGLAPCPPKSTKAIHTLGVVVCRIINHKGTLVFEPGLHCFKNAIERVFTLGAPFLVVTRLHTTNWRVFERYRRSPFTSEVYTV